MAKLTRLQVLNTIYRVPLVPVFYDKDPEICKKVIAACYRAGVRAFEFTNRGAFADKVFSEISAWAQKECPQMAVGAGSVVDGPTAAIYIQSGAAFIVAPLLNEETAKICNRRKVAWMPGCGSLTEISRAEELGAEVVKIFPAKQVGGKEFIKAVKGPCPWTSIMPTGGVTPDPKDVEEWLSAGAFCVGLGSQLFVKKADGSYDTAQIEATLKQLVDRFSRQ